jgi:hypothetical protein
MPPEMWMLGTFLQMLSQSIMTWWLSVPALWMQRHSSLYWVLNCCQSSSVLTWFSLSMRFILLTANKRFLDNAYRRLSIVRCGWHARILTSDVGLKAARTCTGYIWGSRAPPAPTAMSDRDARPTMMPYRDGVLLILCVSPRPSRGSLCLRFVTAGVASLVVMLPWSCALELSS